MHDDVLKAIFTMNVDEARTALQKYEAMNEDEFGVFFKKINPKMWALALVRASLSHNLLFDQLVKNLDQILKVDQLLFTSLIEVMKNQMISRDQIDALQEMFGDRLAQGANSLAQARRISEEFSRSGLRVIPGGEGDGEKE